MPTAAAQSNDSASTSPHAAQAHLDLIGFGSPIMDLLAHVDDGFLREHVSGEKGGMVLIDDAEMAALVSKLGANGSTANNSNAQDARPQSAATSPAQNKQVATLAPVAQVPGGAAANTTLAAAKLGLSTTFLGKVGSDSTAAHYLANFSEHGTDTARFKHHASLPNARCLCLVTPDGQRTMRTHLGAAMTLAPEEISAADFAGARHAHIEGYVLFNPALADAVLTSARAAGCSLSLDLASFEVVAAAREWIFRQLETGIDILFANEDEARALFQTDEAYDQLARKIARYGGIAAVKIGAEGAWLAQGGTLHRIAPAPVPQVIDTTGAGDAWAGGFLYAYLRGAPLAAAGALGSLLGAEAVQCLGAAIPADRWPAICDAAGKLLSQTSTR